MKREGGITLITLTVTITIMGILAALLIKATMGTGLMKDVQDKEDDYYNMINDVDGKTKDIEQKWNGII